MLHQWPWIPPRPPSLPMQLVSRVKLATPQNTRNPGITNLAPRQSYSQVVQTRKPTRDPEKQARDHGKMSHDSSCDATRSHGPTRFRHITHLLINMWQTVGTNPRTNERVGIPPTKRNPQRDSP